MNKIRAARPSSVAGVLLLLLLAACSGSPSNPAGGPSVDFFADTLSIAGAQVGRDTTLTIPIQISGLSSGQTLQFRVTDPHFRVEPEVWDTSQPPLDTVRVVFYSSVADSYATRIRAVVANAPAGELVVAAVASSRWASLHVSPGLVDFGRVLPGVAYRRAVEIENSVLAAEVCTISVAHSIQDLAPLPGRIILAPGGADEIALDLACLQEGRYQGDLEIHSNDPFQPLIRVEIRAECRGIPRLEGLPERVDFRSTAVHVGKDRNMTLFNRGTGRLEIQAIGIPEGVALSGSTLAVAAGGSLNVAVNWTPREPGRLQANLAWRTNEEAPDHATQLAGEGVHGILPAEGLGGMMLHMKPGDILEEFGPPDEVTDEIYCRVGWFFSSRQDVVFFPGAPPACVAADRDAPAIEIGADSSFAGRTRLGLGIGSTYPEIQLEFGLPDTMITQGSRRWVVYPPQGILFRFENDRVDAIDVFRPEDWSKGAASIGRPAMSPPANRFP
jgi:hypothetical protein